MSVRNDDINDTSKLQQSSDEIHPIFLRSYQFHRSAKLLIYHLVFNDDIHYMYITQRKKEV